MLYATTLRLAPLSGLELPLAGLLLRPAR